MIQWSGTRPQAEPPTYSNMLRFNMLSYVQRPADRCPLFAQCYESPIVGTDIYRVFDFTLYFLDFAYDKSNISLL